MDKFIINGHTISDEFFAFVEQNKCNKEVCSLLLKNRDGKFDLKFAVLQAECRLKASKKIPELLSHSRFLFPQKISAEQCTNEMVAKLHAELFDADDDVLDMTMGLGVDSYYISKRVRSVTAIEYDAEICAVAKYNYGECLHTDINIVNADSADYVSEHNTRYCKIFIDPARRGDNNKRMFGFNDCQPNVIALLPLLKTRCDRLLIKASPMLDITQSLTDLQWVSDIWIISIKNSCKELLFVLDFQRDEMAKEDVMIHTVNFDGDDVQRMNFGYKAEFQTNDYVIPHKGDILLEPNASVMKSGMANAVVLRYSNLGIISLDAHLFVSSATVKDFPGSQFKIVDVIPFKSKELGRLPKDKHINVACRNFKLSAEQLKKRLKVTDGGEKYLFGTTMQDGKMVLIVCERL